MSIDYLNKNGLSYFWSKLKAYFAPKAHTHNAFETKHSYTTAANAAKNWYRIANANTSQTDTTKPIHAQFILRSYNTSYDAGYRECWLINAIVYGRLAHITVFGNQSAPFSQARLLYESTVADLDTNDRPAIDIYLNYQLANGTTKIEIEEVYNGGGWTFVADGQIAASTIPTGFESTACGIRSNGVERSTYSDWASRTSLQRSNFSANFTLADNDTYRTKVLNCTGTITVTVPSLNSVNAWFIIKNFNTTSGIITIHPSTTSVLIDGSNANITLQPGEYVMIHSKAANAYTMIMDGRWKSQKADKATTLSGYGITDAKIANGTITLGSSSITPLTSVPSHNQASNTINAMTGYSKPSSTSAIAASDTLNQAIGKLEKAIDDADISNVVHRTGDEAVSGVKTFSNAHAWFTGGPETLSSIDIKSTVLDRNAIPSVNSFAGLIIFDKNATSVLDLDKRLSALESGKFTDGNTFTQLKTYKSNSATNDYSVVSVGFDTNDIPYAVAPSTSTTRTDGIDIVTRDWIPKDTRIVHTTNNETIAGYKTFSNNPTSLNDYPSYILKTSLLTKGSAVSSEYNLWPLMFVDKDGKKIGGVHFRQYTTNRTYKMELIAYSPTSGDTETYGSVAVAYSDTGLAYATAPSTSSDRTEGTDIVTRNWIPNDTRIVHSSGNETVGGVKTFSSNPWIANSDPAIKIRNTSYDHTSTSSNGYTENVIFQDKNAVTVSYVRHRSGGITGGCTNTLDFYVNKRNTSTAMSMQMRYDSDNNQYFFPAESNSIEAIKLGSGGHRWGQFFTTTAPNVSSDERLKQQIASVPDEVLDAWEEISFCQYKLNGSVAEKGESARLHTGLVAQRVAEAFAVRGLDAAAYGLFCWDGWSAEEDSGVEAGDAYSLRYEEALCMEAACQRRENARLKKRVADLEERLAALELRLGSE